MDTGHWIVNATLSKLFKTFSSSNSGVSCWTSVPSWNRAGRLILPEPSCTISVLHRYLHSHLLHQASALFHTRSRPTFFLPRKEFDQPGLFGHRITCRRRPPLRCSIKRWSNSYAEDFMPMNKNILKPFWGILQRKLMSLNSFLTKEHLKGGILVAANHQVEGNSNLC